MSLTKWIYYGQGRGTPTDRGMLDGKFATTPFLFPVVMGRGIERRKIFWNDKDRADFIDRLAEVVEKGWMDIYAWALIPNRFQGYSPYISVMSLRN